MATVAELRVLLDIVVVPDGQYDAEHRDYKQEGHDYHLVPRAQAPFQLIEYLRDELIHMVALDL